MKLTRSCRWHAAVIALISMLFMQLAVAAYACPQLSVSSANEQSRTMTAGDTGHDMSGCQKTDSEQPSLCHAHGQVDKQSLDKPESPPVQPFLAAGLGIPLQLADDVGITVFSPLNIPSLVRTTAPPLAIRHCCFRI
jgi:hypothetical protein